MIRDYFEGADIAVTICAKDGTILDMNAKSRKTFLKPGEEEIIGHNVLENELFESFFLDRIDIGARVLQHIV